MERIVLRVISDRQALSLRRICEDRAERLSERAIGGSAMPDGTLGDRSRIAHKSFDIVDFFDELGGEYDGIAVGNENVVFDTHADTSVFFGYAFVV